MYRKILEKSSWVLSAQLINKVVSFFYTVFLAQRLGVDGFGLYIFGFSYFGLFASLADFGISRYVIKEVVLAPATKKKVLGNVLALRLVLMLAVLVVGVGLAFFDHNVTRAQVAALALLVLLPQSITTTIDNLMVASAKFRLLGMSMILNNLGVVLMGVILVSLNLGVYGAIGSLLLVQLIYLGIVAVWVYRQGFRFGMIDRVHMEAVLKGSLPYGLLGLLGLLYFKVDTLILSYLRGSFETGLYALSYKFLEAVVFLPSSLGVVLFPSFVDWQNDRLRLRSISVRVGLVMGSIGLIVSAIFVIVLPIFINLFLPKYQLSVNSMKILALAIPFMFIHIPLSQILLSSDKYLKTLIYISFVPLIFNVVANLVFIPSFGYLAASWITVLSDIISLLVLWLALRKHIYVQK